MKKNTLDGILEALNGEREEEYEPLARRALEQMIHYATM